MFASPITLEDPRWLVIAPQDGFDIPDGRSTWGERAADDRDP